MSAENQFAGSSWNQPTPSPEELAKTQDRITAEVEKWVEGLKNANPDWLATRDQSTTVNGAGASPELLFRVADILQRKHEEANFRFAKVVGTDSDYTLWASKKS